MSLVQKGEHAAEALGHEMRESTDEHMKRRRGGVGLSLVSIASMGLIALYQTGILKHVPEPSLPGLDADKVNGSAQAYRYLAIPDAVLGIGSYAVTLGLASMGSPDRARRQPWIPLAWAAKAGVDAALSAKLTFDQASRYRAFCLWCLLAAGATFATVPLVIPEARAAARHLLRKITETG
ncbi:MAG TPA: vitamin K epoxide reductase family protein [Terriglobia bacterium]|nr:vitamin K epoxide reductase family protein [Terriglobia bacterium]